MFSLNNIKTEMPFLAKSKRRLCFQGLSPPCMGSFLTHNGTAPAKDLIPRLGLGEPILTVLTPALVPTSSRPN